MMNIETLDPLMSLLENTTTTRTQLPCPQKLL